MAPGRMLGRGRQVSPASNWVDAPNGLVPQPGRPASLNAASLVSQDHANLRLLGLENLAVLGPEYGHYNIAGEGVQQTLLGRALARHGWDVRMVAWDYGQEDGKEWEGIRVFKAYAPQAGLSLLRFFHPRWTGLWSTLARADADLYYTSCAGMLVEPSEPAAARDIDVLWVSNIRRVKRPARMLDLASRLPHLRIHMVGGPLPGEEALFREGLGVAVRTPEMLEAMLRGLLDDPAAWQAASERCRAYMAREHSEDRALAPYLETFGQVMRRPAGAMYGTARA